METTFIPEDEFIQEMNRRWVDFDNEPSERFDEAWRTILQSFNNQLAGQPGLHVCDSVCGSGKTLGVEVASVLLSKHWEKIGSIIVVRLIDQCIDVTNQINELAMRHIGRPIARAMHSRHVDAEGLTHKGFLNDDEVQETQVIVITHTNYIKTISGKKTDLFSTWKHGERKFRVVDESLDLVEQFHLNNEELQRVTSLLGVRKQYYKFYEEWQRHIDFFDDIKKYLMLHRKEGIVTDAFHKLIQRHSVDGNPIYFAELIPAIKYSKEKDYEKRFKEGQFKQEVSLVTSAFYTLDRMLRRAIYFWTEHNTKSRTFSTAEIILPNQFDSLCVLDATSNVDKVYHLFQQKEQITTYEVNRDVRNFRNCKIHIRPEPSSLGIGETNREIVPRTNKVAKWASTHFLPSDKVLFAGHKEFMDVLARKLETLNLPFEWDVCWWNAIDGRNTWKEYNNLVVLTVHYLPSCHNALTKIGFSGDFNPDISLDSDDIGIADSSIAVKFIQLIARIQTRRVINKAGDCNDTNVYMLLPGDQVRNDRQDFAHLCGKLGKYLIGEIRKSMNGVVFDKWTSFAGYASNNTSNKPAFSPQDKFNDWISGIKPGETYDLKDFRDLPDVSGKDFKSVGVLINRENSKIQRQLQSDNIIKTTKRGKGGGTTFTKEK